MMKKSETKIESIYRKEIGKKDTLKSMIVYLTVVVSTGFGTNATLSSTGSLPLRMVL